MCDRDTRFIAWLCFFISFTITACSSDFSDEPKQDPDLPQVPVIVPNYTQWTWVAGSSTVSPSASFGDQGTFAETNVPGGRSYAISWIDSFNHLWLFGGQALDSSGNLSSMNDLWHWNGTHWAWVSGSDATGPHFGVYDSVTEMMPGSRESAASWTDSQNNLWLFGGHGYGAQGAVGSLNDLWRWDGSQWHWVSGSQFSNQAGEYANTRVPGARNYAMSWIDSGNNLWLFGGQGYDSIGNYGELNDLWRWDGSQWSWVSGSNLIGAIGDYGSQGIAADTNVPGARLGAITWVDNNDHLWLFGGKYQDNVGLTTMLNDLWRWDGTGWTWVSGSNTPNQLGDYGVKGEAADSNSPGARAYGVSWVDSQGDFWLFGGTGYAETVHGNLNDLWRWNNISGQWTWISGANSVSQPGVYASPGEATDTTVPGARSNAIAWTDSDNGLWLFGGSGYVAGGIYGPLNDLWRYDPQ